ncbi:MAG: protease complex subunit PrcB family protein [Butyrivibrio sp.]
MRKFICLIIILAMSLSGCKAVNITDKNHKTLDFTVVEREDIPPELLTAIEGKRAEPFSMSYSIDGYLYIAVGYGEKSTGGYSIRVDDLYETDSSLSIHTTLIGPKAGEAVNKMVTYPYVVVKLEYIDKNIIFE